MEEKQKKPFYKRWWFIVIVIIIIIGALGNGGEKVPEDITKEPIEQVDATGQDETNESKENKEELNITGKLDIEFKDNKAVATITTNAIDGSIFETSLMDGNFNSTSDFIEISNGIGEKELDIPEEWGVGYVSGLAMMRFNLEEHPQNDDVKNAYGENGEKLKGDLAVENNVNGYNINLDIITIPYPDEETVKAKQNELFTDTMNELINSSNGVIVNIQPHFEDGDWSSAAVTVSDAWYNSEEYEKERFAESIGDTVVTIIKNTSRVDSDKLVSVYFYDIYGKELATPKVLGGYKIKR